MNKEQAQELLTKYQKGLCSQEEKALLDHWYFEEAARQPMPEAPLDPSQTEKLIWGRIMEKLPTEPKVRVLKKWYAIGAAATVLIFLSLGLYFTLNKSIVIRQQVNNYSKSHIVPGGNKAILTLANGKQIVLTDAHNGTLAIQHSTAIKKTADGKIVYAINNPGASVNQNSGIQYNTITTPRGGQYTVVLPDGSKVSLNAASSLTYPAAFTGDERKVELTGEAYFEVTHNHVKPFKVSSNGQTVEVLGTHFNINAYSDERAVKTTLLEGAVRITKGSRAAVLKPGQQAQINNNDMNAEININSNADIEEAVAWKNGLFMFDGDNIQHIMRMVSRWYDVEVEYKGAVQDDVFGGSVSRFENVSEVLKILQLTGKVHFKIEGRKILVSK